MDSKNVRIFPSSNRSIDSNHFGDNFATEANLSFIIYNLLNQGEPKVNSKSTSNCKDGFVISEVYNSDADFKFNIGGYYVVISGKEIPALSTPNSNLYAWVKITNDSTQLPQDPSYNYRSSTLTYIKADPKPSSKDFYKKEYYVLNNSGYSRVQTYDPTKEYWVISEDLIGLNIDYSLPTNTDDYTYALHILTSEDSDTWVIPPESKLKISNQASLSIDNIFTGDNYFKGETTLNKVSSNNNKSIININFLPTSEEDLNSKGIYFDISNDDTNGSLITGIHIDCGEL